MGERKIGGLTKAQSLRHDRYWRYRSAWGNFKSDNHKTKRTLRQQIEDALFYGTFTKDDLKMIKTVVSRRGFKEFDVSWD